MIPKDITVSVQLSDKGERQISDLITQARELVSDLGDVVDRYKSATLDKDKGT